MVCLWMMHGFYAWFIYGLSMDVYGFYLWFLPTKIREPGVVARQQDLIIANVTIVMYRVVNRQSYLSIWRELLVEPPKNMKVNWEHYPIYGNGS